MKQVALYSQRNNFYFNAEVDMYSNLKNKDTESIHDLFMKQVKRSRPYWDAAIVCVDNWKRIRNQDLFVFTETAFDWPNMPEFVIGRAKFDNWIIQYTTSNSNAIATIDLTNYGMNSVEKMIRQSNYYIKQEKEGIEVV